MIPSGHQCYWLWISLLLPLSAVRLVPLVLGCWKREKLGPLVVGLLAEVCWQPPCLSLVLAPELVWAELGCFPRQEPKWLDPDVACLCEDSCVWPLLSLLWSLSVDAHCAWAVLSVNDRGRPAEDSVPCQREEESVCWDPDFQVLPVDCPLAELCVDCSWRPYVWPLVSPVGREICVLGPQFPGAT